MGKLGRDSIHATTPSWGAKPSNAAPARKGAGWGLPFATHSAVISRLGTGMPPAASGTRANVIIFRIFPKIVAIFASPPVLSKYGNLER
jgi:hypothetical protein